MGAIVLASAVLAVRTTRDLDEAAQSQEVRAQLADLLHTVISAETGQRGYLLTGKESYLQPYDAARAHLAAVLTPLERAFGADADMQALRREIDGKMSELAETVALAQRGDREAALRVVQSDYGQNTTDDIRARVARFGERQRGVLAADIGRSKQSANLVVGVNVAALIVLLALSAFVVRGALRTFTELRAAQGALEAANAELGRGRERLEAAVQRRTAALQRANEEIQRFAYIVSHDLRAPLLNIIGFTGELKAAAATLAGFVMQHLRRDDIDVPPEVREATDADLPEAIRFIETATAKMDRLINAILRLSREGRRVLTPERLDMTALLRGIADSLRHQTEEGAATIAIGAAPDLVGDRIAIEQIFTNVIENALKYPEPGRPVVVEVSGERRGARVVWRVADNGRGIEPRDLERVFELFRRAGPQTVAGEGIGLAHVRALVRRMGGEITCDSTPHEGSVFTIRLPAVLQPSEDET